MQLFFNKQECKQRQQEFYLADKTFIEDSLFVEKVYIKPSHELFEQLTELSFLSKNLYNSTLYVYRQNYFTYKKIIQPILDENGNPIIKMFEATKRGRKLKDGNGNKIIENAKQIFDKTEIYQINLDTINPVGLDVNLNQLAIAYFNKTLQQEKKFSYFIKTYKVN